MLSDDIKEQIYTLVKLQKIDIEINSLKSTINSVSEKLSILDDRLNGFERRIEEKQGLIDELKKNYRDRESDFQLNLDREKKIQAKLRSVKTNKEYQSLLKEIDDVRNKNSTVEDEMIECLDRMDDAEKDMMVKRSEYSRLADEIELDKKEIFQQAEHSKDRLAVLTENRQGVSVQIDSNLLKKYTLIKERNKTEIAVVAVKDAVCLGCTVNITPPLYNELHRGDTLNFCPNCQRIIFWEGG